MNTRQFLLDHLRERHAILDNRICEVENGEPYQWNEDIAARLMMDDFRENVIAFGLTVDDAIEFLSGKGNILRCNYE